MPELGPFPLKYSTPQRLGVVGEDVFLQGRLDEPGVLRELILELARAPTGVASEDSSSPNFGPDFGRYVADQKTDRPEYGQVGMFGVLEVSEENGTLGLYRPAPVQARVGLDQTGEGGHGFGHTDGEPTVQDDTEGAVVTMLPDQDDGMSKVRVEESAARNQEVAA